jgi:hypothetical protein
MAHFSTREAAKKLGIAPNTLALYIRVGKVPTPHAVTTGGITVHLWTEDEIERVRKLLPKIANGRKTRWQRQREKEKAKTQPRAAGSHKQRRPKKK